MKNQEDQEENVMDAFRNTLKPENVKRKQPEKLPKEESGSSSVLEKNKSEKEIIEQLNRITTHIPKKSKDETWTGKEEFSLKTESNLVAKTTSKLLEAKGLKVKTYKNILTVESINDAGSLKNKIATIRYEEFKQEQFKQEQESTPSSTMKKC